MRRVLPCLLLAAAAQASSMRVGTFTKTTAAAPVVQSVAHGLGEPPKLVILWTAGKTDELVSTSYAFSIGASDGATDRCTASYSSGVETNKTYCRRYFSASAIDIETRAGATAAQATVTGLSSTSFQLSWTINDSTPLLIHYVAIGGSEVSAKVLGWTMSGTLGPQAVTGAGFRPEAVLSVHGGRLNSPLPVTQGNASLGAGAADALGNQWATSFYSI